MQGGDPREKYEPQHPLGCVRSAFRDGRSVITMRVRRHMALRDWKFTQELAGDRFVVLSFCLDGEDH